MKKIEQRNLERLRSPWKCKECGGDQPPPITDAELCQECSATAIHSAIVRRLARIPNFLQMYGVPPTLSEWVEPLPGAEWLNQYGKPNARGLYLYGGSGTGKSVAAALVIRAWLKEWAEQPLVEVDQVEREWRFIGCAAFVMQLQEAWRDGSEESAFKILKRYAEVPHLVIDDLGTEKATDFVKQSIYFLINEREQWGRQTIITSNFPLEAIDEQYDQRISSRIVGMCDVRSVKGKDHRVEK